MRVLVTGGAGFIGSNLIRKLLLETDFEIVNVDAMTYAAMPEWNDELIERTLGYRSRIDTVLFELGKDDLYNQIGRPDDFDAVFHLAAESHVCNSIETPEKFLQSNSIGTFMLLEWLRSSKKPPKSVFVSTDEVFGELQQDDPPFDERTQLTPRSPYASTKAAADLFALSYYHTFGLPIVVTNCGNNFGPNQHYEKLIPRTIKKFLDWKPATIYGTGAQIRDWIHVDDHNEALLAAWDRGVPGERYCIGARCERTNATIINSIYATMVGMGAIKDGKIVHTDDRPTDDFRYALNPAKMEDLGWKVTKPLETSLLETIEWYLSRWT